MTNKTTVTRFAIRLGNDYYRNMPDKTRHWVPIYDATLYIEKPPQDRFPKCKIVLVAITYEETYLV